MTDCEQAEEAVGAGAAFVVTPGTTEPLGAAVTATGVASIMGALTPSEVAKALAWGATAVKLFPGSIGGPANVSALRGPFPDLAVMSTGGVGIDNLRAWFDAGATCVGAGGELCPSEEIAAGERDRIERRAVSFTDALAEARA